jgi:signal transduction histidine kinase
VPDLILIALTPSTAAALREVLGPRVTAGSVVVRLAETSVRLAIEAAREELGPLPLGIAARTRAEAIEAIELGADEALCIDGDDVVQVNDLVDRARMRGVLRADGERAKVAVAHAEKLAALGTLVAGVAHEISNPLAAISLILDAFPTQVVAAADAIDELTRARDGGSALGTDDVVRIAALARPFGSRGDVVGHVDEMRTAVRTIHEVVKDLRVFARAEDSEPPQVVNVPGLVEQILRLVGREIVSTAIIERDYGEGVPDVVIPHARLTQVLTNVLVNTTHALREATRPVHRVRITLRADDEMVAISISDTGPGIAPSAIERIFDPFYTTKRANLGTGLGLSISRNLMRKMGGDLLVESVFGEGATFIVLVPRSSAAEVRAAQIRSRIVPAVAPPLGRGSVLVLDASDQMLRAYSRVLGQRFDILIAGDSQEAIEMLSSGSSADAVLADLGLSPLDGAHLYQWLAENQPDLAARTVFVAAEPALQRARREIVSLPNPILPKPTPAAELVSALERVLRT